MRGFIRYVDRFAQVLTWITVGALVFMMVLTCCDIVLRYLRFPIPGTWEIVGFMGAIITSFAMAGLAINRRHVAVEIVVAKLPRPVQKAVFLFVHLLSFGLFALLGYESMKLGYDLRISGEVSPTIHLPFVPVLYGIGFSAFFVALVLLIDFVQVLIGREKPWYKWS